MHSKYRIIIIITSLLLILSISLSSMGYFSALNNTQEQLTKQSLPLSLDNIYTDIQKSIIEPHLVSSMMANDTFVHEWLQNGEKDKAKIIKYLKSIKNKYNMFSTFFVSEKTKDYFTHNGFIEKVSRENSTHKWYYKFLENQENQELNLDFNKKISNNLILFINYKIFDKNFNYLGTTGVALKISYINDLLKKFRQEYNFIVTFFDEDGNRVLSEKNNSMQLKNIDEISELKEYKDLILSKELQSFEYLKNEQKHIVNTKYIKELNLYLTVDANLEDFIQKTKETLYFDLFISFLITLIVSIVIFVTIKKYSDKIEKLSYYDTLTGLANRRYFKESLGKQILFSQRNKNEMAMVFMDIDNFKLINDTFGHNRGDDVLKIIAKLLSKGTRKTDLVARWGGEEFVIVLINSSLDESFEIVEKLRLDISQNFELKELIGNQVTGSFGLSMILENDTQDEIIARADNAMYDSKQNGKNKTTVK